jgi:precorrin-4/cobalt-precorrin-4 C11-methyltransferase
MNKVHFVGAGPGAPDLISVRGKKLLEGADIVIYAGSLVNPALLEWTKKDCAIYNSAAMTLDEVIAVIKEGAERGDEIVRLHTGDPGIYGAIREQIDALRKLNIKFDICPGISSFSAAAAALEAEYTLPGVSQTIIISRASGRTGVPERENLASLASHNATMILFLSAGMTKKISRELISGGLPPDTPAAIVYKASWPEQSIIRATLATLPEKNRFEKTALVVVGNFLGDDYERSRLYAADFSTEYRKGSAEGEKEKKLAAPPNPAGKKSLALVSVSKKGAELAGALLPLLEGAEIYTLEKYILDGQIPFSDINVLCALLWNKYKGIIFVCASGIAVRSIAPHISSKHTDPAIVVTGDEGAFIISLLSGHEGGANELAQTIARVLSSVPVVTTASESSPRILPRNLIVGIGLKRGIDGATARHILETIFAEHHISPLRIASICSIDIKRDEKGLRDLAETLGVPLYFYSAEYLNNIEGDFTPSEYVKKITGTDNVCERAAAAGCGNKGKMLIPKTAREGVTISIFKREAPMALFAFRLVRERVYHYLTFS